MKGKYPWLDQISDDSGDDLGKILDGLRNSIQGGDSGDITKYKYVRKNDLIFRPLPPKLFDNDYLTGGLNNSTLPDGGSNLGGSRGSDFLGGRGKLGGDSLLGGGGSLGGRDPLDPLK